MKGTFTTHGTLYAFQQIPCDIGGMAFEVKKVDMSGSYYVRMGAESTCECMGFLRHGKCRHITGLRERLNAACD